MKKLLNAFVITFMLSTVIMFSGQSAEASQFSATPLDELNTNKNLPKSENRISEIFHKLPLISKLFNKTVKMDYVVEDIILTKYMLGDAIELSNNLDNSSYLAVNSQLLYNSENFNSSEDCSYIQEYFVEEDDI